MLWDSFCQKISVFLTKKQILIANFFAKIMIIHNNLCFLAVFLICTWLWKNAASNSPTRSASRRPWPATRSSPGTDFIKKHFRHKFTKHIKCQFQFCENWLLLVLVLLYLIHHCCPWLDEKIITRKRFCRNWLIKTTPALLCTSSPKNAYNSTTWRSEFLVSNSANLCKIVPL
jgi:hypothetical protein